MTTLLCVVCGSELKVGELVCSVECQRFYNEATTPIALIRSSWRTCDYCGKPFHPRHPNHYFCCTIHQQLKNSSYKNPTVNKPRPGLDRLTQMKLQSAQIEQIIQICSQRIGRYPRWPLEYVAALFGVSRPRISQICRRYGFRGGRH